jgi:hypothetical protein
LLLGVLEQVKDMKDLKNMRDMTKTREAEKTTRVEAMEKEGIAGSGIMNEINDVETKSIGHGIEDEIILRCVLPLV